MSRSSKLFLFFLAGLALTNVCGITVLNNINGKQYMLSSVQLPYDNMTAGCAAMNATVAFLDTNTDFIVLRDHLSKNESLANASIWLNITKIVTGTSSHYFWQYEEVSLHLWWATEPNKQGSGEGVVECGPVSEVCRPVIMTRLRQPLNSSTHDLMDTCCVFSRYFLCEDIDECSSPSLHACPVNSQCNNTAGSYTCSCLSGFMMDQSGFCHDIDECLNASLKTCPHHSHCNNTEGGYMCVCDNGFQNVTGFCEDINECWNASLYTCPRHSHCNNTEGSYACECDEGFQNVTGSCDDINECIGPEVFACPPNSVCINTPGNYSCTCKEGYEMKAAICQDMNECINSTEMCSAHGRCVNTNGSFYCLCDQGYQWSTNGTCYVSNQTVNKCPCKCHFKLMPSLKQSIWSELLLNVDTLSYTKSFTRFQDQRTSIVAIGFVAMGLLSCFLCWLVFSDVIALARYLGNLHCASAIP